MIKGKKGALELSVNTIVVIVIGVTLLILGLVFVRNIFTKIFSWISEDFSKNWILFIFGFHDFLFFIILLPDVL